MRRDLAAVLEEFVATHRGLRLGRLFGEPAAFAGRRVFAKLDNGQLKLRVSALDYSSRAKRRPTSRSLSAEARSAKVEAASPRATEGREPTERRSREAFWVCVSPTSPAAARLEMLLEQSARYVALA